MDLWENHIKAIRFAKASLVTTDAAPEATPSSAH
jgi:hypothetical protein